jgi:hypothetical protein
MEAKGSLLYSYEPEESNPHHKPNSPKISFNIILSSMPSIPRGLFSSDLQTKILYILPISMCATCHANLVLLDFITLIIYGEEH